MPLSGTILVVVVLGSISYLYVARPVAHGIKHVAHTISKPFHKATPRDTVKTSKHTLTVQ